MDSELNQYSPEEELAALPRDYTLEMAVSNNDVIYTTNKSYNTDRFLEFLNKVNNGISDKIRITSYGIDGPVTTSILQYDGNIIRFIADVERFGINEYYSFYGYQIISQTRNRLGRILQDFSLITIENKSVPVFMNFLR